MITSIKDEGFVLKKKVLLNKDVLLTLFTKHEGKVLATAKGASDIKSRRLSAFMTGNLVKVVLRRSSDRYYLQETQIVSLFTSIKKDENKQRIFYFFLFILDALLPEGQSEISLYSLLQKILIRLTRDAMSKNEIMVSLKEVLSKLGYGSEMVIWSDVRVKLQEIIGKKIPDYII